MDMNAAHHPLTPAPYGRACVNCSKAKSRCIASKIAGVKCERYHKRCILLSNPSNGHRCRRLNKECRPSLVVRKRRAVKNPLPTKTARLEEKLDGLVSLLQSADQSVPRIPRGILHATQTQRSFELLHPSKTGARDDLIDYPHAFGISSENTYPRPLQPPQPMIPTSDGSPLCDIANSYIPYDFDIPTEEAEEYLRAFRTYRLRHFPFITLSSSTTFRSLRHHRPFLWLCIIAVCSTCPAQQLAREVEVRTILGRQMLIESDKSLDMLLGLLVYIAWGQSYQYKPIVSTLVQMALALLGDLGLQRNPPKESPHMMLNYDARGCPRPFNPKARTLEERRAALACYLHGSTVSAYFQKIDPPRWSAYLESCLQVLSEYKEDLNDALLVLIIRLQLVVDRIALAPWQLDPKTEFGAVMFYIRALEVQLEDVKKCIPPELEGNETLLLHLHHTTLTVHEVSLSRFSTPTIRNAPSLSSIPCPTNSTLTNFDRLSSLTSCLHATKSWFTTFLSLPSSDYPGFPTAILIQMAHSIIVLYRLLTFEDADWDLGLVRSVLDFGDVLDQLIEKVESIKRDGENRVATSGDREREDGNGGIAAAGDTWASTEKRLRGIASSWRTRNGVEEGACNSSSGNIKGMAGFTGGGTGDVYSEDGDVDISMEFWDDSWLDVIGLRDCHF